LAQIGEIHAEQQEAINERTELARVAKAKSDECKRLAAEIARTTVESNLSILITG